MLPSFLIGLVVFIFVLLMFQILRLTEFVLVHGVDPVAVFSMMSFMTISFLPILFPMSLLFAILLTYGRFSSDSEIVAFKSLGLNTIHLSLPALILALLTTLASIQVSFELAPWGNRAFEVLIHNLKNIKASVNIKAGVFSEGFYDMVIYANDVDTESGELRKVFIFDERNPKSPITVIAKTGQIFSDNSKSKLKSQLLLTNGNIHKTDLSSHTKIDFNSYDINLFDNAPIREARKSPLSHSSKDIKRLLMGGSLKTKKQTLRFETELYRRWALAFACFSFSLVGIAFGIRTNSRQGKSNGVVLSITLIVAYWILYVTFEGLSKKGTIPPIIGVWVPNIIFLALASTRYKIFTQ